MRPTTAALAPSDPSCTLQHRLESAELLPRTGTGINRRINRAVLDADELLAELAENPRRRAVFDGMAEMLRARRGQPAFSPYGDQQVEELDDRVFAVRRGAGTVDELLSITNVTGEPVSLEQVTGRDVITGKDHSALHLDPWGYLWLRPPVTNERQT